MREFYKVNPVVSLRHFVGVSDTWHRGSRPLKSSKGNGHDILEFEKDTPYRVSSQRIKLLTERIKLPFWTKRK